MSEWLKLMLGEIDRRRQESDEAQREQERRAAEREQREDADVDDQRK